MNLGEEHPAEGTAEQVPWPGKTGYVPGAGVACRAIGVRQLEQRRILVRKVKWRLQIG